ncbi:hypothetical protein ASE63_22580 [Bosea sp. Root381]|uniref:hypothetical protein n=1 Tax=Bosea sp. Root381 TaxID=1736524 RepID=UPI0006F884A9|nr:hypothetical protein [Bosea sp. Root381]KRE07488.1 hypothetical protein ASE63_22580 [Bosea sp. Root381]
MQIDERALEAAYADENTPHQFRLSRKAFVLAYETAKAAPGEACCRGLAPSWDCRCEQERTKPIVARGKTTFGPRFFEDVGRDPDKWVAAVRVRLGTDAPSDQILRDFFEAALYASPAPLPDATAGGVDAVREAMAKLDEARISIFKSYRHLAARDLARLNDAYDLLAALASPAPSETGREAALREIADQDVTEIALDPDWPRRIASAALTKERSDER